MLGIFLIVMCFLVTGCQKDVAENQDNNQTIYVENEIIKNLKNTVKIDIKSLETEEIIGTIIDGQTINELIDIISNSSYLGNGCLADNHQMELEMYNEFDNLLDTIAFWPNVERIRPESSSNDCYFNVPSENSIKNIIEENTN